MKKTVLFCTLVATVYASNDYMPLSKISDDKKLEYNFITLDNTVIQAEKVETKAITQDGYESIPNESYEIKEMVSEKVEEVKEIKVNNPVQETKKQIIETNIKVKPVKKESFLKDEIKLADIQKQNILQNTKKEENLYNPNIKFTAQITYSPLSTNLNIGGLNLSNDTNGFVPELSLEINEHKVVAEYFKAENSFASIDVETTIYKLGYRYKYLNANIGIDANYAVLDSGSSNEEFYPSFEIDFTHKIENIELSYGAGIGKNDNIEYAYDYFFDASIKPYSLSDASLVAGYKNRTIKDDDSKIEFKGPYIGVRSSF